MKSTLMVGFGWLLFVAATNGADDNESQVEKSVAETRASLLDLDLMSKGISRSGSSSDGISIDLSEGLQTNERATLPNASRVLDVEQNSRTRRKKEWAARNWLLAGVQEQSKADSAEEYGGTELAGGELKQGSVAGEGDSAFWLEEAMNSQEANSTVSGQERGAVDELYATTEIVNPLDSFLGDWLASSELERLDQVEGALSSQNPVGEFSPDVMAPRVTGGQLPRATLDLRKSEIADVNPYLGGWEQSEIESIGLGLKPAEPSVPAGRLRVGPINNSALPEAKSAASDAAQSKTKEAWKPPPRTDEKYFPRLKRF